MQDRQLLGNRYVLDINVVAIYLVENHPGNKYISEIIDKGITSGVEFLLFDFIPFRVYWILTSKWKVERSEAEEALCSFLRLPNISFLCMNKKDVEVAFKLSKEIGHDIYDTIYAVLAKKANAKGIITTDCDFEKICEKLRLHYLNPVPKDVLREFHAFK